jgi:hypothetical protein
VRSGEGGVWEGTSSGTTAAGDRVVVRAEVAGDAGDVVAGEARAPSLNVLRPDFGVVCSLVSSMLAMLAMGDILDLKADGGEVRDEGDEGEEPVAVLGPGETAPVREALPFSRPAAAETMGRVAVVPERFLPTGGRVAGGGVEGLTSHMAARARTPLAVAELDDEDEVRPIRDDADPGVLRPRPTVGLVSSRSTSSVMSRSRSSVRSSLVGDSGMIVAMRSDVVLKRAISTEGV